MKQKIRLMIFSCLVLVGTRVQAQVKDMPSQAEFDPILDNADSKVKDFIATLTKYQAEANEIDKERLEKDLHDLGQLRAIIAVAHSGNGNHGINLQRIFGVVGSVDDAALEAAVWSSLIMGRLGMQPKQSLLYFGLAVQDNEKMLAEVSGQLFHPAFRMMAATDEILQAVADAAPGNNEQPRTDSRTGVVTGAGAN
jgi:hypothetical protein